MSYKSEDYIREQVRRILREEKEEPKEEKPKEEKPKEKGPRKGRQGSGSKGTGGGSGKVFGGGGSGNTKEAIKGMKSLAETKPKQLMKNLGIGNVSGKETIEKIENLVKSARSAAAFGKAFLRTTIMTDKSDRPGVMIAVDKEVGVRDGAFFIKETIKGARGAGVIDLEYDVRIQTSNQGILVYQSDRGKEEWAL